MSIQDSTPGVYINEITGPGVIQGVGTSTAAFIGPTASGPPLVPLRINNFEQFARSFGGPAQGEHHPHLVADGVLFNLSLAVRGFFQNEGTTAYIVRVDNSTLGELAIANAAGDTVATARAATPQLAPTVTIARSADISIDVVYAQSAVDAAPANPSPIAGDATNDLLVADASGFEVGDRVFTDGTPAVITHINANWIRPSAPLNPTGNLAMAPLDPADPETSIRLATEATTLRVGSLLTIANAATTEAVVLTAIDGHRLTTTPVSATVDLSGDDTTIAPAAYQLAEGQATVTSVTDSVLTLDDATPFAPGDTLTDGTDTATVVTIDGNEVTASAPLANGATVSIVDFTPERNQFRLTDIRGLRNGTVLNLDDGTNQVTVIVTAISSSGLVTVSASPARTVTIDAGADVTPVEFSLTVTADGVNESWAGLSMNPTAANYLFAAFSSEFITLHAPEVPLIGGPAELTPAAITDAALSPGVVGNPAALGLSDYEEALAELARIDDVNMVAAPDAASLQSADVRRAVNQAIIGHCLEQADRIAIIDPPVGLAPSGPGSIEEFRADVQSERGFATLYYPWLRILDPLSATATRLIPPSGHMAGVMARVDAKRGVFKPPANVPIRNVLGVERRITDREQAPLNRGGTNVLRILPGSNEVTVWGARTTVDPAITDWMYVNVRRLLLFIEESIQESIRWAVFEPNDMGLWKSLDRVIRTFLRQQWRAGALFGATEEEAFKVQIDEAINPPEVRNVGRLNIAIAVSPVRPAEFIVIEIGLFDGGTEIAES